MKTLAILALLVVPVSVHAQEEARLAARQLAANCAVDTTGMSGDIDAAITKIMKSPERVQLMACLSYIRGVIDTWLVLSDLNEKGGWELTGTYSPLELKDAFMASLKEHPEMNSLPASIVLFGACKEHHMVRYVLKEEKKP